MVDIDELVAQIEQLQAKNRDTVVAASHREADDDALCCYLDGRYDSYVAVLQLIARARKPPDAEVPDPA